jgi:cell wall-associated NlpC family hydrolase
MSRSHARRRSLASFVTVLITLPLIVGLVPGSASAAQAFTNLGLHQSGPRVTFVQRALDLPRTGTYNVRTRTSVKVFQHQRGLATTGVVNLRTWHGLQQRWNRVHALQLKQRKAINAKYHRIIKVARNQFGDPYRYGAAGPSAFDCSGYTLFVYAKATGKSLPHLASGQYRMGRHISRAQARPGDLVFFHSGGSIYHAAIYAGHGDVYHSPHSGTVVQRDPIWTSSVYYARILPRR